ncbi:L-lactate permease, partial [bacterium]
MWSQVYDPLGGNLVLSAAAAALPIVAVLIALGLLRLAPWKSGLLGLAAALAVAILVYG